MEEVVDIAEAFEAAERAERLEQLAHQLEQRARSFRIRRDRYLEPIGDQNLTFQYPRHAEIGMNDRMQFNLGFRAPFNAFHKVYRPKGGDYRNLQLFSSSLVRFEYESDEDTEETLLFLFLALPQGSLAVLTWLRASLAVQNVVFNGVTYSPSIRYLVHIESLDTIKVEDIFLPPGHTIAQHGKDLDTLLLFMTSLVLPKNVCIQEPEFRLDGDRKVTLPISSQTVRSLVEALVLARYKFFVCCISFSEEHWQLLQSMPFQAFDAYLVELGSQFLRQTPAKKVKLWPLTPEQVRSAFIDLGKRQKPIDVVKIEARHFSGMLLTTTAEADILLAALVGVSNLKLHNIKATPAVWVYFWLQIRQNKNLISLSFIDSVPLNTAVGDDDLWWLVVIRDCLLENWFLESIELSLDGEALAFWQAEVLPPLQMNATHKPRVSPSEHRLWVVHDAIIRVSSHPTKTSLPFE